MVRALVQGDQVPQGSWWRTGVGRQQGREPSVAAREPLDGGAHKGRQVQRSCAGLLDADSTGMVAGWG